ncbi:MAG: TagF domain-containing protein [Planctomycetota bacterium]
MIAAYGKLGISKEYLRHQCHDGIALKFRQWMDSGFDHAATREALPRLDKAKAQRIYYRSPNESEAALALAIPSRDASGTREFPFGVLRTVPRTGAAETSFSLLEAEWTTVEARFDELIAAPDTDDFFARAKAVGAIDPSGGETDLGSLGEWVSRLYRYDPVDLLVRALWRLRVLRPHLESEAPELRRLRVPLAGGMPTGPQVDVWAKLLGGLHPVYSAVPSWSTVRPDPAAKPKPAAAWLVFGEPRAVDFGPALGGKTERDHGVDLVDNEGRLPVDGFGEFRERLEAGPLRSEGTFEELLAFEIAG